MSDDNQQPNQGQPAPSSGYGQPYGYGPQPYDYPQQAYQTGPSGHDPYGFSYGSPTPPMAPYGLPTPPEAKRNWGLIAGCAAIVAALVIAVGVVTNRTSTTNGTALDGSSGSQANPTAPSTNQPNFTNPFGGLPNSNTGNGGSGNGNGSNSSGSTGTATAAQQIGVVDIDTIIGYRAGEAAGTGLVLDSSGDVLTNNHVIEGATTIRVTIVSTGKTYTAKVVGTAPTQDIAVIKLIGASGLTKANFGDSSTVKVGDKVMGVGNAGGAGGTPSSAAGTVTALNQTITASDESGGNSEQLTGVIATNAPIKPGDSGGPLYNSSDKVIGIDTAANTTRQQQAGFAIPINHALSIASQIESGVQTSSIHIGTPAALGISVQAATGGVGILTVYPGLAAAKAGLVPGDLITGINGTSTPTLAKLKAEITAHEPGTKVSVTYTDQSGTSHTVTVTLSNGPAD